MGSKIILTGKKCGSLLSSKFTGYMGLLYGITIWDYYMGLLYGTTIWGSFLYEDTRVNQPLQFGSLVMAFMAVAIDTMLGTFITVIVSRLYLSQSMMTVSRTSPHYKLRFIAIITKPLASILKHHQPQEAYPYHHQSSFTTIYPTDSPPILPLTHRGCP